MKLAKTRETTLSELAARSTEGKGAAKRFEALVKRLIKIPPQAAPSRQKAAQLSRDFPTCHKLTSNRILGQSNILMPC